METQKKWKIFNAAHLKLLAMGFMLCDHLWATVIPGSTWLNDLGRLAFPIFAFQIVEGYHHTHSFRKYLSRLFLFALISEIPFNLMTGGSIFNPFEQNVLFTFCLGLVLIRLLEKLRGFGPWVYWACVPPVVILGALLGQVTFVNYFGSGVVLVLLYYLGWGSRYRIPIYLLGMMVVNSQMICGRMYEVTLLGRELAFYQQSLANLALIPIGLYNGSQGPHSRGLQLACYWFYPVHMLVLSLIWLYVVI